MLMSLIALIHIYEAVHSQDRKVLTSHDVMTSGQRGICELTAGYISLRWNHLEFIVIWMSENFHVVCKLNSLHHTR